MDTGTPLSKAMNQIVEAAYQVDEPGAVLLLSHEGRSVYRRAIGMADLELRVPLSLGMVFRIASLTKPFTALAVLRLADAGKLALADRLTSHLPDFSEHGITLEHLLTHTSGLPEYLAMPEWAASYRKDTTPAALAALFKDAPLAGAPGAQWSYCNAGYVALGLVIEKVTGLPYAEYMTQEIFAPAGLAATRFDDTIALVPGRVRGHQAAEAGFVNADFFPPSQSFSAGGLLSTAADLCHWTDALFAGKLLRPETLRRAFSPFTLTDGSPTTYGCGWILGRQGDRPTVEHLGLYPGFAHYLIGVPEARLTAVALTNRARGAETPEPLVRRMIELALA